MRRGTSYSVTGVALESRETELDGSTEGPVTELSNHQRAVELLQQLGLKEYEAKCFVALSRLPKGTAKEISETCEVPRTRVYDSIRVLQTKGLVEIQHVSPQQFRAVSIDEAAETLRREYETRTDELVETVENLDPAVRESDRDVPHEVWSLSGASAIANRTQQLVDGAGEEIILVVGHEDAVTEEVIDRLKIARETGISVIVGAATARIRDRIEEALPDAEVFVSGLKWLQSSPIDATDDTAISRLLLIDRSTILVSSVHETTAGGTETEKAVFGRGFDNGIVVIARRLMETGLRPGDEPDVSIG